MSIVDELKRRNVFRVALAYIIVAWLVLQVADNLGPALLLPDWFNSVIAAILILGFAVAVFLAWIYELTPAGIQKDAGETRTSAEATRKLDVAIIALLVIVVGLFAIRHLSNDDFPASDTESGSRAAMVDSNSIAVLPFVNISDDQSNEYFADGITEELLNLLSRIPGLKVTSRSSAFSFKGQDIVIPDVAAQLNVAHILEGSVRKAGNTVRITAQLIKADEDVHVWSASYDRELTNIFAIQDEIARAVVDRLHLTLLTDMPEAMTTGTEAYEAYLGGLFHLDVDTSVSWPLARAAFEDALALDDNYAPAWLGLSRTLWEQANFGQIDLHEGVRRSREAAEKAVALDRNNAEVWAMLAFLKHAYDWDWASSRELIATALDMSPNSSFVNHAAASIARTGGQLEQAHRYSLNAFAADPLGQSAMREAAWSYFRNGDSAGATALFEQAVRKFPYQPILKSEYALLLALSGKFDEALDWLSQDTARLNSLYAAAIIHHEMGNQTLADEAFQAYVEMGGPPLAYQFAQITAQWGNKDEAFVRLRFALERRDGGMTYLLCDPFMVSLYDDPRWQELLNDMALADDWDTMPRRL